MKTILFGLVVIVALIGTIRASDYCRIQNERCGDHDRHVGCPPEDELVRLFGKINVEILKVSEEQKDVILGKLNSLKNEYANGDRKYIPSASKLSVIKWSDELEHLANITIHLQHDFQFFSHCYLIDGSPRVRKFVHRTNFEFLSDNEVTEMGVNFYIWGDMNEQGLQEEKADVDRKWFASELAQTTKIGCAYGIHDNRRLLVCLHDLGAADETKYDEGEPASRCHETGQRRSDAYGALCEN